MLVKTRCKSEEFNIEEFTIRLMPFQGLLPYFHFLARFRKNCELSGEIFSIEYITKIAIREYCVASVGFLYGLQYQPPSDESF